MKKQIEFDFAKWGQDGISVNTHCIENVATLYKNPFKKDTFYGVSISGIVYSVYITDLTMYQEVKPREIYVNEPRHGLHSSQSCFNSLEFAKNNYSEFDHIRTVKFIEVIEDEKQ